MNVDHLPSDQSTLDSLSKQAGVDFAALKTKYSNKTTTESISNVDSSKDTSALDKYKICSNCNGQGIIKSIYNHMVVEKDCEVCDGESIVLKKAVESISKSVTGKNDIIQM